MISLYKENYFWSEFTGLMVLRVERMQGPELVKY